MPEGCPDSGPDAVCPAVLKACAAGAAACGYDGRPATVPPAAEAAGLEAVAFTPEAGLEMDDGCPGLAGWLAGVLLIAPDAGGWAAAVLSGEGREPFWPPGITLRPGGLCRVWAGAGAAFPVGCPAFSASADDPAVEVCTGWVLPPSEACPALCPAGSGCM